jgi:integrase
MRGNITRRGKHSWRIKFDAGTDQDGKRLIQYQTVNGTKRDAEAELAKRLNELSEGRYVAPTVETVGSYALHWLESIAPVDRCAATVARYRTIITAHIVPGLGSVPLKDLDGAAIDRFYAHLRTKGHRYGGALSSMTVNHIHRRLSQILASAVKARKLARSPLSDIQTKPKPKRKPIRILDEAELAALLAYLKGRPLYMPALLAAYTGLRRGEVLALRWKDIDFTKAALQVAHALEVVDGKLTIVEPKTDRSKRTISLPASLIPELTHHRKEQAAWRLKLGLGKTDFVFTSPLGGMIDPTVFSESFTKEARGAGTPITFHGLRHSHITHLLRAGVPVHIVSARAGHARPSITLDTYSHLLGGDDEKAAELADAMLLRALK